MKQCESSSSLALVRHRADDLPNAVAHLGSRYSLETPRAPMSGHCRINAIRDETRLLFQNFSTRLAAHLCREENVSPRSPDTS